MSCFFSLSLSLSFTFSLVIALSVWLFSSLSLRLIVSSFSLSLKAKRKTKCLFFSLHLLSFVLSCNIPPPFCLTVSFSLLPSLSLTFYLFFSLSLWRTRAHARTHTHTHNIWRNDIQVKKGAMPARFVTNEVVICWTTFTLRVVIAYLGSAVFSILDPW